MHMRALSKFVVGSLAPAFLAIGPALSETPPIALYKPIDCSIGIDCFIQQYADHDPGKSAVDYTCGSAVYDGHDGTDFRLPDKVAQARGVAVVAAADGVVMRLRDGEPDFDVGTYDAAKVRGDAECGNGVVINHRGGWQTQYCHMQKGSIRVKAGDPVEAGTPLGLVGQSGQAAFIHLHLSVRHDGQAVDPFAFGLDRCDAGTGDSRSLWRSADRQEMRYRDAQVINAGFASDPVSGDDIERGGIAPPGPRSPALVFYVRAIALRGGDVQSLALAGPDGAIIADSALAPLERDKAQYQAYAGKKLKTASWPPGTYRGTYRVSRGGAIVLEKAVLLDMP
jgi:hypothetical protein